MGILSVRFQTGLGLFVGGLLLGLLFLTKWLWPQHAAVTCYDFLFLAAVAIQLCMLLFRLETLREATIILIFHLVGTVMELFKTGVGSWTYPEASFFRIGGVPLFSGFMYAAIGSYLARVIRILDMRYADYPNRAFTVLLAILIYANFFTHHYMPDIRRLYLSADRRRFRSNLCLLREWRRMPLILGFGLVAFFIWFAENIGTFTAVWLYPHQVQGWELVRFGKYGSWFLLMIISFILVSFVSPPRAPAAEAEPEPTPLLAGYAGRRSRR